MDLINEDDDYRRAVAQLADPPCRHCVRLDMLRPAPGGRMVLEEHHQKGCPTIAGLDE